jgi:hypothetical protein
MRLIPVAATLALLAFLAPPAGASVISYLDGGEVWRASLDGSRKLKLSGPPTVSGGYKWRESAQADNGRVLAVGRPDGKIATVNTFTLWGPDGAVIHQGILQDNGSWTLPAFPVSLDLNAGGTTAVYGYSTTTGFYPNQIFEKGTYVMPVDKAWVIDAYKHVDETWPTIAGSRLVSAAGSQVNVQDAAGAPYDADFTGWLDTTATGKELNRTDVAATGKVAAIELVAWNGGTQSEGQIAMIEAPGLGLPPSQANADQSCLLPVQGIAGQVSLSQDGKTVAWHDDRGVVVAGAPNFPATGESGVCVLTRAPVVISATGTEPSIGGTSLPAAQQPGPNDPDPDPDPQLPAAPALSLAAKVKASALKKGLKLKVTVGAAGIVKATGKIKGKTVAKGSKRATGAGTVTLRLKATKKAAKKLAKLRGKKLKIKVTAGGQSTTITRKLR